MLVLLYSDFKIIVHHLKMKFVLVSRIVSSQKSIIWESLVIEIIVLEGH